MKYNIDDIFCDKEITFMFCIHFDGKRDKKKRLFYDMIKEIWDKLVHSDLFEFNF